MGVIVEDERTTNANISVDIPTGRHSPLLLYLATAYNWDTSAPTRSAPSGGGGMWTAAGSNSFTFSTVTGEGTRYISMCVYGWYSVPTLTGTVSITAGGATNEEGTRDHVYSLSNADYDDYDTSGYGDFTEIGDNAVINKQGGACFGASISAYKDSLAGNLTPLYDTTIDYNGGVTSPDISGTRAYTVAHRNIHRGNVGPGGRFVRNIIRWDSSTSVTCAGLYISIDSVECLF